MEELLKTESYANIGGKNAKASPLALAPNECLDILNFDFTHPGAYTVRPGSTPIISQTYAVTSFFEFSRLNGASYKVYNAGSTLVAFNGSTSIGIRGMGMSNSPFLPASTMSILSFAPFVDRLFVAGAFGASSSGDFFKTDGATAYLYSLPAIDPLTSLLVDGGSMVGTASYGWTGYYQYGFAWLNERGYIGPLFVQSVYARNTINDVVVCVGASSSSKLTFNFTDVLSNLAPAGYGITAMVVFRSGPLAGTPGARPGPAAGITYLSSLFDLTILSLGSTTFSDFGATLGTSGPTGNTLASQSLWFTLTPRYVDTFNNSLLMFGFSSAPSTVFASAIGEPELVGSTQSFDVRTNDSDRLAGGKNYLGGYFFFKTKSFHVLTGNNPSNYSLSQVSDQYGCLSHRAITSYNSYLLFLDRKGICQFDGAEPQIISNRVEPTFRRMNVQAAIDQAVMVHVKDRNEVWCAFPIDGATLNNRMVIYDYVANAFSEWSGPQIASLGLATDPTQFIAPFYGDYSGVIQYFNASLWTDSGRSFTCMVTPRWFGNQGEEMGYSVEKQFRRVYFDMLDPANAGQTTLFTAKLFADFSTQIVQTQTFATGGTIHTQTRIDFGIPAKAFAYQMLFQPQTPALQFPGFTVEYRFQRAT